MSLEQIIEQNSAAVAALTAAILGNGKVPTAPPAGKSTPAAAKPKATMKEVTDAAVAVKAAKGEDAAKELIRTVGKAASLKEVLPANFDALVAACKEALEAVEEEDSL